MSERKHLLAAALLLTVLLAGCGDAASTDASPGEEPLASLTLREWTLDLYPRSAPFEAGEEEFRLELTDANGPVSPQMFEVEPWMPSMGHGSPEPTVMEQLEPGVYEATVTFSMPGSWQLRVVTDGERSYAFDVEVDP